MKKTNKQIEKKKLDSFQKAASRQEYISQGGNDGRYMTKLIPDKKKEAKKNGWE